MSQHPANSGFRDHPFTISHTNVGHTNELANLCALHYFVFALEGLLKSNRKQEAADRGRPSVLRVCYVLSSPTSTGLALWRQFHSVHKFPRYNEFVWAPLRRLVLPSLLAVMT